MNVPKVGVYKKRTENAKGEVAIVQVLGVAKHAISEEQLVICFVVSGAKVSVYEFEAVPVGDFMKKIKVDGASVPQYEYAAKNLSELPEDDA